MLFTLPSFRRGKLYTVTPTDVQSFYEEHARGVSPRNVERAAHPARFTMVGTALLQLFGADGLLKHAAIGANLVVNTGLAAVIDRLQGNTPAVHDYQAIGTGTTAPAAGDTTLQTEVGTRIQGALTQPTATTDRLVSTFPAGNGTGAITETGRLNASSAGNLLARLTFSVINKAAGDSLQITHDLTVS